MPTPLSAPTTPHELTSALRAAGTLRHGDVASVEVTAAIQTTVSSLRFLEVSYKAGATPSLPERLLLKWPLELPLLRFYHQEVIQGGIAAYSLDDLLHDYRRCVVRNLTFPIIFWSRGFPRKAWRYRLDCALAAYHDLNAAELL